MRFTQCEWVQGEETSPNQALRGAAPALRLIRLDSGCSNYLAEARNTVDHQFSQIVRRTPDHGVAVVLKQRDDVGLFEDFARLRVEPLDNRVRRRACGEETKPGGRLLESRGLFR